MKFSYLSIALTLSLGAFSFTSSAQTVQVGDGSYTRTFPGTDVAGRNSYPSGTPYTTGAAASKPVPTNDWWSAQVKNAHADNLFNYPFTMKSINSGLIVTYIPWGVIDNIEPVVVGVSGLNASAANISDFSDWTITMDWQNSGKHFTATSGIGMPFIYFTKDSADVAQVTVNEGSVSVQNEMLVITDLRNSADFAVYAPSGSTWQQSGNTYTSTLNGKNYWSLGFIPLTATNVNTVAADYKKYAYVFPTNTSADWDYNENTAVLTTEFKVQTDVKEGTDTNMLLGLLPHQWANLSSSSPQPSGHTYSTVRGDLKTLEGNSFSVSNSFHGILPTLPFLDQYSEGFSPGELLDKIDALKNDQLNPWTDSYNEGQMMNRLIQSARIADLMGDTSTVQTILETVKERLEDWLSYESGEVAFLFYYNQNWTAMIGYPAGHGQDGNINDHHFHWGYFIHAASFVEQYEPGWANDWGGMIDLLIRDAASENRNDNLFPFLRNFSPFTGHCWANGFASFPQGNDQESTSESMQFNSSLIHWGSITNNKAIRDLGIYLYTTEQTAIEEYWFDQYERNFGPTQQYSLVSRVWGNSYDNGTFWTSDIAASYGIELYPIHGGSLYLGHDTDYVDKLWTEMAANTGILNNEENPNLWHDIYWEYLAFIDPEKALDLYDSYPERGLKFGVSDAQTYHWLHAMNALGRVDASITADHALAAVFVDDGSKTYVAQNYGGSSIVVNFSDGFNLSVPAGELVTSRDIGIDGYISTPFAEVYPGGSIPLSVTFSGGTPNKVEFMWGDSLIGQVSSAPFVWTATDIPAGRNSFYARIYDGSDFGLTNILSIFSGEQLPYSGFPAEIPGTIEAGEYDLFEGGSGFGVSYHDNDRGNNGDFRENEGVDAGSHPSEGKTVGWIAPGEWLEYTVDVQQAGLYNLSFRYACGNNNGGGPFHLVLDEDTIKSSSSMAYTSDWDSWRSQSVSSIPMKSGVNVLRIAIEGGEFNLGKLTFTYSAPLPFSQPRANAGSNQLVQLPQASANLDGSGSSDPQGGSLNYRWTQIYGPSVLTFSNANIAQPAASGLVKGVYLLELEVDNGSYGDRDLVYLISSTSSNVGPKVSINAPFEDSRFLQAETIEITALASDLNGQVQEVSFYADGAPISTDPAAPFQATWSTIGLGEHQIHAVAKDDQGAETSSGLVSVFIDPTPPCLNTSSNGEFEYEFSPDKDNPTLTFIPGLPGMGSPTCILYYSLSSSPPFGGYPVTPNVPFTLNASEGSTVYFYYTYSYPSQGEHNNGAEPDSYKVGSCTSNSIGMEDQSPSAARIFPNPVSELLHLQFDQLPDRIEILNIHAQLLTSVAPGTEVKIDVSEFASGIYLIRVVHGNTQASYRLVKE
jgi:endoglucanase Acf2